MSQDTPLQMTLTSPVSTFERSGKHDTCAHSFSENEVCLSCDADYLSNNDVRLEYRFFPLQEEAFVSMPKNTKELLSKWGMKDTLQVQMFSFDQQFLIQQKDIFVENFFQDEQVIRHLSCLSDNGIWHPIGVAADSVTVQQVPCSITSMNFFDRLQVTGIIRESGEIVKCFDEYHCEFIIADELRKMLLSEESEHHDIFNESERAEFLFLIFKHLCLGGYICQYEDNIEPYLETTKLLYKNLVRVEKDPASKSIRILSIILKVTASDDELGTYYPDSRASPQSFAYIIVDPLRRQVACFYHKWAKW